MSFSVAEQPLPLRKKLIAWGCILLQLLPPVSGLAMAFPAAASQHMLPSASTPAGSKDPFQQQLASGAMAVGTTLSDEDRTSSEALSDYARSQAGSAVNSTVEGWLSQFGTVKSQISLDKDFSLSDSSLDMLLPLYDSPRNMLFTQMGARRKDDRTTLNLGIGMRFFPDESWMVGTNAFYDNDITGHNTRLGLGAELWADYLKLSMNGYQRLSSWHASRDFEDYDERPANGFDLQVNAFLPAHPQLGGKLVYEQYYGDEVALFGKDDRQKDPYAVTVGVNYTPIPMLSVGAEQKMGKSGKDDFNVNMALTYQLDQSWARNASPEAVDAMRKLARSRYDLVERNNNIVLEYRKRQVIKMQLAPEQVQGESKSTQTLTATVSSKHGLKNIVWSGGSFQQSGGIIKALDTQHFALTLPAWKVAQVAQAASTKKSKTKASDASRILNTYVLTAVAEDSKGNKSKPSHLSVEVLPPQAHFGSDVTVSGDNAQPDGVTPVNVVFHVIDGSKQPLAGEPVTFAVTLADSSKTTKQGVSDASGNASLDVVSTVPGEATVVAKLSGGDSRTAKVHFAAADVDTAHSSLAATPESIVADGRTTTTLTLTVHDNQDRPLTGLTGVAFKATGVDGTNLSAVKEASAGNYTATMSGAKPGTATVTAQVGAKNLSGLSTTVVFTNDENNGQIKAGDLTVITDNVKADGHSAAYVQALVTDADSNPLGDRTVTFTATSGATIQQSAVTNSWGKVRVPLTHTKAGIVTVTATVNGSSQSTPVTFIADNTSANGRLNVMANNAVANGTEANVVELETKDAQGNAVTGIAVTFSTTNGAKATPASGVTDNNGKLTTTLTSTVAGDSSVTAKASNGDMLSETIIFEADTSTAAIAAEDLTVVTNNAVANGSARNQVQVKVTDAKGNPVPAQVVNFSAANGAKITASATTDAHGLAVVGLTSQKAGDSLVTATLKGKSQSVNTTFVADKSTAQGALNIGVNHAVANGTATNSVALLIKDASGNPLPGTDITFSATNDAAVTPESGVTDSDGKLSATLTSTVAGSSKVTAKSATGETLSATVDFVADTSTATILKDDLLVKTNNAVANNRAQNQISVRVTDAQGNPVPAQVVTFTADNEAKIAPSATTNSQGMATVGQISQKAGDSNVIATVLGHSQKVTTTFIADKTTGQGTLTVSSDKGIANGTDAIGIELVVQDAGGNPISGTTITFSATNGATVLPAAGITDSEGKASATLTSLTAGASKITAKSDKGETLSQNVTFTADPATATIVAGALEVRSDKALANGSARNLVRVKVTDAKGNAVSGQKVTFSADNDATIEPAATTDASGMVSVGLTSKKAGTSQVTASVNNDSQTVTTTFVADKTTMRGALTTKVDGSVANGTTTNSVQAVLSDANGNPIENEPVSFSANNGANITPSATTNASGIAEVTLTNTRAGITTVTGSSNGTLRTVSSNFIADTSTAQIADGAMTIVANHAATDGIAANRVRVAVTDAFNNILSHQLVGFTASNGAVIASTATTDTNGIITLPVTSTTAGDSVVQATLNGSSQHVTVSFEADGNTAHIADGALVMANDGAVANGTATNRVQATVTDAGGNPVADATVSFSASNSALIAASTTTDASGKATATLTSKVAGKSVIVATVNGSSQQVDASFVADSDTAQIKTGSLKVMNDGAVANGTSANRVALIVTDASGNTLADQSVSFTASNGANIAATATTGTDGALDLPVTSTLAGESVIKATVNGSSLTVTVTFVYDPSTAQIDKLTLVNDHAAANGSAANQVKVRVKDAKGNLAKQMNVSLSASNGATVAATGTTDDNGEYLASLTSQVAGDSQFTAEVNGYSDSITVNFAPDNATAHIADGDLTVTRDNAPADGKQNNRIALRVTDANGNVLTGQTVSFTADNGAKIAPDGVTGTTGTLSVPVTSTVAGESTITASINKLSQSVKMTFTYDTETATVSALTAVSDDALANGTATNSVKAVILDAQGNPVPDMTVAFSADNGADIAASGISDASGEVVVTLTNRKAGQTRVSAQVNGHSLSTAVNFKADGSTAQIVASSLVVTKDNAVADGVQNNRVQLAVTDTNGNVLSGETVNFTADNSAKIAETGTTEADGTLSLPVTSIKAGDSNITASIKGSKQSVKMTFSPDNATATVNSLIVISDKSVANGKGSNSVKAIVRDAKGNYVPDMVVYFSADNGAKITASGTSDDYGSVLVALTNLHAGITNVTLTVNGAGQSIPTTFIADASTAVIAAGDINVLSDNAPANGVNANHIQVIVKDANDNLVADKTVSFSAAEAGVSVASTAVTDSAGQITVPVTSTVAGAGTIKAKVNASEQSKTVTFIADSATASIAAADFKVTKNNALSDGVDANQVQALVKDAQGNIVSDALVNFSASNGAVVGDVVPTNAQGLVTANITTIQPGISQITATINGQKQSVNVSFIEVRVPVITAVNDVTADSVGPLQSGQLTNEASPVLTGTADKNVTIRLYNDGKLIGTSTADASGDWTIKPASPLTVQGNNALTVTAALTPESPESAPTEPFILNLDSIAVVPGITRVTDSGNEVAEGGTTNGADVVIWGTAEPRATVNVYAVRLADRVSTLLGTTTATESGSWNFEVADPRIFQDSGEFRFQAKITDTAGNSTKSGDCPPFTVYFQNWPAPAGTPDYLAQSSSDDITSSQVASLLSSTGNALIISRPPANYANSIDLPAPSSAKGANVYISIDGSPSTVLKIAGDPEVRLSANTNTTWYSNGTEWRQVY